MWFISVGRVGAPEVIRPVESEAEVLTVIQEMMKKYAKQFQSSAKGSRWAIIITKA